METSIVGVGVNVTDRFRSIVEEKTTRIEHLATRAQRVDVKVTHRAYHNGRMEDDTVELTVTGKGPIVRAEAPHRIDHTDLTTLLYYQGYRFEDFETA